MSDEKTYTLAEARRVMALRQCAASGHEWNIIAVMQDNRTPLRIVCEQCGWSGSVTMGERPAIK